MRSNTSNASACGAAASGGRPKGAHFSPPKSPTTRPPDSRRHRVNVATKTKASGGFSAHRAAAAAAQQLLPLRAGEDARVLDQMVDQHIGLRIQPARGRRVG